MSRPLVVDTDPGLDDALALLVALGSPEVRVEGISTVAGNVSVDAATVNVFRILEVAAPAHPLRVARGAAAPLARPLVTAAHVHGPDGLGGVSALTDPGGRPRYPGSARALEPGDGADLILDLASRFGSDLTLLALGPLTNVALALRRDARRLGRIGRLVVMGGAVAVPGNVTAAAEFNFFVDPEAAAAVVGSDLPLELGPLDVTRETLVTEGERAGRIDGRSDPAARFVRDFTGWGFASAAARGAAGLVLHDPLAAGATIDQTLVGWAPRQVTVECAAGLPRGRSRAEPWSGAAGGSAAPPCRVATSVDAARFLDFFLERVCRASA
jgi:purine nucleosidase/pyrimidine-specific ribonucleoside hydrolase